MDKDKKNIEFKSNIDTCEYLSEYFKREYGDLFIYESGNEKIATFLKNVLEYDISNLKIVNKRRKEVTIKEFLKELKNKIEEGIEIDISICKSIEKYIDFEKTNIDVSVPIDIDEDTKQFLIKLKNCNKIVHINETILHKVQDIEWIKNEKNIFISEKNEEECKLEMLPEELVERHKIYRKYILELGR